MLNSVASTTREERNTQMMTTAKRMKRAMLGMLTLAPLAPLALAGCGEAMSEEQLLLAAQEGDKAGAKVGQSRQEMISHALNIPYTDENYSFGLNKNGNQRILCRQG